MTTDRERPPPKQEETGPDAIEKAIGEYLDELNSGRRLDPKRVLAENPLFGREILRTLEDFVELDSADEEIESEDTLGTLGDYTLRRQIGRGGMGVVYDAWENSMDRPVALKVIPSAVAADTKAVSRFVREAQVAGKLHHPHIVPVYAMGVKEETPYYAMELVAGETLAEMLARLKDASPDGETPFGKRDELAFYSNVAAAFAGVAEGLQHAHSEGVIHRDIKPSNLILDTEGDRVGSLKPERSGGRPPKLRILDFGLAHLEGQESLTMSGDLLGTVLYMSPEQAMAKRVPLDHRTDVYSLGATMYEMLTGEPPFRGKDQHDTLSSIIVRDPRPPRQLHPRVPRDLETIVLKCLMKDPGDRYGTAEAMGQDLRRFVRGDPIEAKPLSALSRIARRAWRHRGKVAVAVTFVVLLLALAGFIVVTERREGALRKVPQISELLDQGDQEAAWELLLAVKEVLGTDETIEKLIRGITKTARNIGTDPPGARFYYKPYGRPEVEWRFLGTTPLKEAPVPYSLCRYRMEKEGFPALEFCLGYKYIDNLQISLQAAMTTPSGMVYVFGGKRQLELGMLYQQVVPPDLEGFYIDTYEVTNGEFKEFVDAGGYRERAYWEEALRECGVTEPWEKVVAEFDDKTDQLGPAEWRDGSYPEGKDDYPVTGVSWFEAAAYAKYRKKRLPSVYHWTAAATPYHSAEIFPLSNIGKEREPASVGQYEGMSGWGAYDMAGNVREWCWNESGRGRFLLGGGSRDPDSMFTYPNARDPFERSADAGFRCVQLIAGAASSDNLWDLVDLREQMRDYSRETPMSEEEYLSIKENYYSYDRTRDLRVHQEERVEEKHWVRERITIQAAYNNERVPVILFLPKGYEPPYQPIFICPNVGAWQPRTSGEGKLVDIRCVHFLVESGRAVIYPISEQTYERCTKPYYQWTIDEQRGVQIATLKDYSRTIDYLETRSEFDTKNLGYFGNSAGAYLGPLLLGLEPRLDVAVLKDGGLATTRESRDIDKLHFAPRVKVPVLMLNGEWDFVFPCEEAQLPLFDLLGTPPEKKKHVRYSTVHGAPWKAVKEESLKWFDKYLGVPRREAEAKEAGALGTDYTARRADRDE